MLKNPFGYYNIPGWKAGTGSGSQSAGGPAPQTFDPTSGGGGGGGPLDFEWPDNPEEPKRKPVTTPSDDDIGNCNSCSASSPCAGCGTPRNDPAHQRAEWADVVAGDNESQSEFYRTAMLADAFFAPGAGGTVVDAASPLAQQMRLRQHVVSAMSAQTGQSAGHVESGTNIAPVIAHGGAVVTVTEGMTRPTIYAIGAPNLTFVTPTIIPYIDTSTWHQKCCPHVKYPSEGPRDAARRDKKTGLLYIAFIFKGIADYDPPPKMEGTRTCMCSCCWFIQKVTKNVIKVDGSAVKDAGLKPPFIDCGWAIRDAKGKLIGNRPATQGGREDTPKDLPDGQYAHWECYDDHKAKVFPDEKAWEESRESQGNIGKGADAFCHYRMKDTSEVGPLNEGQTLEREWESEAWIWDSCMDTYTLHGTVTWKQNMKVGRDAKTGFLIPIDQTK